MALGFPTGQTRSSAPQQGYPLHPEPRHTCHCGARALLDEIGSCVRCGRFPQATISQTWEQRKRELAARRDRKRGKGAR